MADRFQSRRSIYILCNFFSAALWGLFLLTTEFHWMLAISVIFGVFYAPLIAFLEAFSMDTLGRDKKSYGRMRVWGSVAFICVVLALGQVIKDYSVKIILVLILIGSWIQAGLSLGFPKKPTAPAKPLLIGLRQLLTKQTTIFFCCAFLMLVSHGAYYAFFSIHLNTLGFDSVFIGISWAVAVCFEILAMLFSERIFKRLDYHTVLILSFAVAALRWFGLWLIQSPGGILALQATHALTYGTFHMASILYIDAVAPEEAKTVGQAVNNAVTYGLGLMVGFFVSGALYETMGSSALFAASAGVALSAGLLFQGFVRLSKQQRHI